MSTFIASYLLRAHSRSSDLEPLNYQTYDDIASTTSVTTVCTLPVIIESQLLLPFSKIANYGVLNLFQDTSGDLLVHLSTNYPPRDDTYVHHSQWIYSRLLVLTAVDATARRWCDNDKHDDTATANISSGATTVGVNARRGRNNSKRIGRRALGEREKERKKEREKEREREMALQTDNNLPCITFCEASPISRRFGSRSVDA